MRNCHTPTGKRIVWQTYQQTKPQGKTRHFRPSRRSLCLRESTTGIPSQFILDSPAKQPPCGLGSNPRHVSAHVDCRVRKHSYYKAQEAIDREVRGRGLWSLVVSLSAGTSARSCPKPKRRLWPDAGVQDDRMAKNERVWEGKTSSFSDGDTTLKV